jgi:thiamine-phosphate pyrophosphorylase
MSCDRQCEFMSLPGALRLYAITDRRWLSFDQSPVGGTIAGETIESQVEEAILGGATIIQLREKNIDDAEFLSIARSVKKVTDSYTVPLIVNDILSVALSSGASGLHVGQGDGSVKEFRARLGMDKILGVSVQTMRDALAAEASGADYLGVGAMFPTGTKEADVVPLELLSEICAKVRIPVVAIGGITAHNASLLAESGIAGISVISALFANPLGVRSAAKELRRVADIACRPREGCVEAGGRP